MTERTGAPRTLHPFTEQQGAPQAKTGCLISGSGIVGTCWPGWASTCRTCGSPCTGSDSLYWSLGIAFVVGLAACRWLPAQRGK